jgi:diketogulonate reductase-like aldo/keto reductase
MNFLVKEGLTKTIGVSAFSLDLLKEVQTKSDAPIVANQIEYSLFARNIGYYGDSKNMEKEVIPYQKEKRIITMSVRPLERGLLLTNKTIQEIANKYGKTPAQVSLNWLIQKKGIVAIPKATKKEHLEDNLGALGWELKKVDLKVLDELKEIDNFQRI